MNCQVVVEQGILQGKECKTFYGKKYYSFEGIPYAQPPIGKLRFSNPKPIKPWEGIFDATKPGHKCIQANPYSTKPIDGSEDCLYLNIYTPVLPHEKIQKLPVLFFIHGGRLIFGHGNYYTPDYLIKNDVILVTINYRLHILGFLCLNIPECTGNMGLKDAALALKWVSKNVASFNGDGRNITVMGESAGAAIATSFLTTKMVDNCFSKVICVSGTCISDLYMVDEDPIAKGKYIASLLGKDISDPKEIYNLLINTEIEDLLFAFTQAELSRPPTTINAYFLPVVEQKFNQENDIFFTEHPTVSLRTNNFKKVPIITCIHSLEAAAFFGLNGKVSFVKDFNCLIPRFANIEKSKSKVFQKKILDFYLGEKYLNDDNSLTNHQLREKSLNDETKSNYNLGKQSLNDDSKVGNSVTNHQLRGKSQTDDTKSKHNVRAKSLIDDSKVENSMSHNLREKSLSDDTKSNHNSDKKSLNDDSKVENSMTNHQLGEKSLTDDFKFKYLTMMSDAYFTRDLMFCAEIISKFWDQVYVLKFDYLGGMNTRVMRSLGLKGATHGDMIQYQFYRKNKAQNCTEKDQEIVEFFSESFTNFMKYGKPTWRGQKTKWLPYTNKEKRILLVNEEITLQKDLDRERLLFWIRLLSENSKL